MTERTTVLERMYPLLKKTKILQINNMKRMSDELGCSLAYISHTLKMIRTGELASMDVDGNTKINHPLPPINDFIARVNEEGKKYRSSTSGTGVSRGGKGGKRKVIIPEEFEINETTIIPVLQKFFQEFQELKTMKESEKIKELQEENEALKDKNAKLIKYIKVQKQALAEILD